MTTLGKFGALAENFSHVADFMIVYTEEAHPEEKGDFTGLAFEVETHKTLEDRVAAARYMLEAEPEAFKHVKVVVDGMNNLGSIFYATIPERQYIVHNGKTAFVGGLGPFKHVESLRRVKKWLTTYEQEVMKKRQFA